MHSGVALISVKPYANSNERITTQSDSNMMQKMAFPMNLWTFLGQPDMFKICFPSICRITGSRYFQCYQYSIYVSY